VCCSSVLQWCVSVVCQHRRWVSCSSELQCFVTIRTCKKACWLPRCHVLQNTAADCKTLQHTAPHLMHQSSLTALMHCTAQHCTTLHHTAPHYTTQHHIAPHCNTLQHTATHCNTPPHTATRYTTLQTHYDTLQHMSTHYIPNRRLSDCPNAATHWTKLNTILHYTAKHCNTLQHTAYLRGGFLTALMRSTTKHNTTIHYNILQHTATHCNTLLTWQKAFWLP